MSRMISRSGNLILVINAPSSKGSGYQIMSFKQLYYKLTEERTGKDIAINSTKRNSGEPAVLSALVVKM